MKPLLTKSIAMIATLTLISACSKSDSKKDFAAPASPDQKTESTAIPLIGQFQGTGASCEAGGEAKEDSESTKGTLFTFNEDGTFITVTKVVQEESESVLETKGTFTVSENILTIKEDLQTPEGEELESKDTSVRYQLDGDELTLTVPYAEDGSCPVNEALILKYQRVQATEPLAELEQN